MPIKRRLEDLYVVGRDVVLADGLGDPVTVWMQKVNMVEQGEAVRRADAAKSRALSVRSQPESDDYQALVVNAIELGGVNELVDYLMAPKRIDAAAVEEARIAAEEEWSDGNYLQGLRDVWDESMRDRWLRDNDDVEPARVLAELRRFNEAVTEAVEDTVAAEEDSMQARPLEELRSTVIDHLLEAQAAHAWAVEFYAWQLFAAVRDPDNKKERYFAKRAEIDVLAPETYRELRLAYESMDVEVVEGKDSPVPEGSSPSSEPPTGEATDSSSGPVAAMA